MTSELPGSRRRPWNPRPEAAGGTPDSGPVNPLAAHDGTEAGVPVALGAPGSEAPQFHSLSPSAPPLPAEQSSPQPGERPRGLRMFPQRLLRRRAPQAVDDRPQQAQESPRAHEPRGDVVVKYNVTERNTTKPLDYQKALGHRHPLSPWLHTPELQDPDNFAPMWMAFGKRVRTLPLTVQESKRHPVLHQDKKDAVEVRRLAEMTLAGPWHLEALQAVHEGNASEEQLYTIATQVHPLWNKKLGFFDAKNFDSPGQQREAAQAALVGWDRQRNPRLPMSRIAEPLHARLAAEIELHRLATQRGDEGFQPFALETDIRLATTFSRKRDLDPVRIEIAPELLQSYRAAQEILFSRDPGEREIAREVEFSERSYVLKARQAPRAIVSAETPKQDIHPGIIVPVTPGRIYRVPETQDADATFTPEWSTKTFDELPGMEGPTREMLISALLIQNPAIARKWGVSETHKTLLWGPTGNGKTSLVKAAANYLGWPYITIQADQIHDMYHGETAKKMRKAINLIHSTREDRIVYFPEIDATIHIDPDPHSSGAQEGNSAAGIFKHELEQVDNPHVWVIADTNDPERLDQALIREGRFSRIFVPNPSVEQSEAVLAYLIGRQSPEDVIRQLETSILPPQNRPDDLRDMAQIAAPISAQAEFRPFDGITDLRRIAELAQQGTNSDETRSRAFLVGLVDRLRRLKAAEEIITGNEPPPVTQELMERETLLMVREHA